MIARHSRMPSWFFPAGEIWFLFSIAWPLGQLSVALADPFWIFIISLNPAKKKIQFKTKYKIFIRKIIFFLNLLIRKKYSFFSKRPYRPGLAVRACFSCGNGWLLPERNIFLYILYSILYFYIILFHICKSKSPIPDFTKHHLCWETFRKMSTSFLFFVVEVPWIFQDRNWALKIKTLETRLFLKQLWNRIWNWKF